MYERIYCVLISLLYTYVYTYTYVCMCMYVCIHNNNQDDYYLGRFVFYSSADV